MSILPITQLVKAEVLSLTDELQHDGSEKQKLCFFVLRIIFHFRKKKTVSQNSFVSAEFVRFRSRNIFFVQSFSRRTCFFGFSGKLRFPLWSNYLESSVVKYPGEAFVRKSARKLRHVVRNEKLLSEQF